MGDAHVDRGRGPGPGQGLGQPAGLHQGSDFGLTKERGPKKRGAGTAGVQGILWIEQWPSGCAAWRQSGTTGSWGHWLSETWGLSYRKRACGCSGFAPYFGQQDLREGWLSQSGALGWKGGGVQANPDLHLNPQIHGRGAAAAAALHLPALRGRAPELPRGAAGAAGGQADTVPRPEQVPLRRLSRDSGEGHDWGGGHSGSWRGLRLCMGPCGQFLNLPEPQFPDL